MARLFSALTGESEQFFEPPEAAVSIPATLHAKPVSVPAGPMSLGARPGMCVTVRGCRIPSHDCIASRLQ